jgi:hypothetical protein
MEDVTMKSKLQHIAAVYTPYMKDFLKYILALTVAVSIIILIGFAVMGVGKYIVTPLTHNECECRYWRTAWDEHPVVINRKCELIDGYVIAGSDTISPYKVSNVCR